MNNMELWIRSQDKYTLIKSSRIYVFGNTICDGSKEKVKLAEYKTIERALEVLDEIQKLLQPHFKITAERITGIDSEGKTICEPVRGITEQLETYVYEMPQE